MDLMTFRSNFLLGVGLLALAAARAAAQPTPWHDRPLGLEPGESRRMYDLLKSKTPSKGGPGPGTPSPDPEAYRRGVAARLAELRQNKATFYEVPRGWGHVVLDESRKE